MSAPIPSHYNITKLTPEYLFLSSHWTPTCGPYTATTFNIPPLSFRFGLMILSEPPSTSTTLFTCYYFNVTPTPFPFLCTPWCSLNPPPMILALPPFHLLSCTHTIIYVSSLHHKSSSFFTITVCTLTFPFLLSHCFLSYLPLLLKSSKGNIWQPGPQTIWYVNLILD